MPGLILAVAIPLGCIALVAVFAILFYYHRHRVYPTLGLFREHQDNKAPAKNIHIRSEAPCPAILSFPLPVVQNTTPLPGEDQPKLVKEQDLYVVHAIQNKTEDETLAEDKPFSRPMKSYNPPPPPVTVRRNQISKDPCGHHLEQSTRPTTHSYAAWLTNLPQPYWVPPTSLERMNSLGIHQVSAVPLYDEVGHIGRPLRIPVVKPRLNNTVISTLQSRTTDPTPKSRESLGGARHDLRKEETVVPQIVLSPPPNASHVPETRIVNENNLYPKPQTRRQSTLLDVTLPSLDFNLDFDLQLTQIHYANH